MIRRRRVYRRQVSRKGWDHPTSSVDQNHALRRDKFQRDTRSTDCKFNRKFESFSRGISPPRRHNSLIDRCQAPRFKSLSCTSASDSGRLPLSIGSKPVDHTSRPFCIRGSRKIYSVQLKLLLHSWPLESALSKKEQTSTYISTPT